MAVAATADGGQPEKVEQEGDHRTEIVSGSGLRDQQLAHWPDWWRGTVFESGVLDQKCPNDSVDDLQYKGKQLRV